MIDNIRSFPVEDPFEKLLSGKENTVISWDQMSEFEKVFDDSTTGMVLVDEHNYIKRINRIWKDIMFIDEMFTIGKRFGDGFRCIESLTGGCGNGEHCIICNINNQVRLSVKSGQPSYDIILHNEYIVNNQKFSPWFKTNFIPLTIEGNQYVLITADDIMQLKAL